MKISQKLFRERVVELSKNHNGRIDYYTESGMYTILIDGIKMGEVMSLKEAYKSIALLEDVLNLITKGM